MEPNRTLRVLLAENSLPMRRALQSTLHSLPGIEIAGKAVQGREALDVYFRQQPEIVILSVSLPAEGGFEVLRTIKQADPDCNVILTTSAPDPFIEQIGLLLGATQVCSLADGPEPVRDVIQRLSRRNGVAKSAAAACGR
jgi:DNA-binding NarL/FixJ family response regulator